MLSFFKHKKFWLPLLILLGLLLLSEGMLKAGWYDRWLKPKSFMGNALNRVVAIEQVGLENIHWISVGDSRFDWGIDHGQLATHQRQQGLEHVRMSFESSSFAAIQATIGWSMDRMPNLQGIVLGINEGNFARHAVLDKQYKVAWPFKQYFDFTSYDLIQPPTAWESSLHETAWYSYFADVLDFIRRPLLRMRHLNNQPSIDKILNYKRNQMKNLCAHPLATLDDCVASVDAVDHNDRKNSGFSLLKKQCGSASTKLRATKGLPMQQQLQPLRLVDNWTRLLESVLKNNIQLTLVLLPEHESHQYIIKHANAGVITEQVVHQLQRHKNFKLIDLRGLFNDAVQCEMFADPLHYNNQGITAITQALIKQLH